MTATGTAFVTGSTGFVGKATVKALLDAGWTVIQGKRPNDSPSREGVIYTDLAQPATFPSLDKLPRVDAIIHLGALVGLAGQSDADLFIPNVQSTDYLAHIARVRNAYFIFASTAIVHGTATRKIDANSPLSPDNPYARSKWLAEQAIEASGTRHCILRMGGVFGSDGPRHLNLNRSIDAARGGQRPVLIGSGKALRNYIYVKDVAGAIVHSLRENIHGAHLAAGHDIASVSDMLNDLCGIFLPGQHPVTETGREAEDQVIEPSVSLPRTRSFRDALMDIRMGERR